MKKVLFIDRDGTIIREPLDEQIDNFEKLEFLPAVITSLAKICMETDYELVMVTNQDGLGTSSFPEDTFWPVQNKMLEILKGEGVIFKEIFIDRSFPEDKAPTRKPGTAMLTKYLTSGIDTERSYVIGDRANDMKLAENIGCKSICIGEEEYPGASLSTNSWTEIHKFLKAIPRTGKSFRRTSETTVNIEINLDGNGNSRIQTGIGFFDHMLGQIARHAEIDLFIEASGDLESDEHHLIEDVAIVLGEVMGKALGSKRGIDRYGFTLPMDDSLASVAIDFGGRAWLVWDASFKREKVGEMPTEMFYHFFKSFSDNARCNLNIKAEGVNEHHMIESVFKAFAKALKMAVRRNDNNSNVPSTKGSL
jgi:imidazoleglycerol-phosphate dehydratase / histidinol-phosphatase